MSRLSQRQRKTRGSALLDFPVAVFVLFVCLTFPLINFATICLRSTFVISACRDAVHAASQASTFQTDLSSTSLSAVNAASTQASQSISTFGGITLTSTTTSIVITNLNTGVVTTQTTTLNAPADIVNNLYTMQVKLVAQVQPLLSGDGSFLGSIPGLTGPISLTVTQQEFCENPQGLNQ